MHSFVCTLSYERFTWHSPTARPSVKLLRGTSIGSYVSLRLLVCISLSEISCGSKDHFDLDLKFRFLGAATLSLQAGADCCCSCDSLDGSVLA